MNNSFADWNPLEDNNDSTNVNNTVVNTMGVSNQTMGNTPLDFSNGSPNIIDNPVDFAVPQNEVEQQNTIPQQNVIPQQYNPPQEEIEILDATIKMDPVVMENNTNIVEDVNKSDSNPMINPTLPNTSGIQTNSFNSDVRYNPVTGEEMNVQEVIESTKKKKEPLTKEEKQAKKGQVRSKIRSTWNTLLLIGLFIFLIIFVYFLPEVSKKMDSIIHGNKDKEVEVIKTGKLICTLETNTINLDRSIERIFEYEDNKLKSSKFTTIVRGDITLDEDALDKINEQCLKVKDGVKELEGVSISCNYEAGKLEEKETFQYKKCSMEEIGDAYLNAGTSLLELEYDQDIDKVMTLMRQGGFTCNKEK